MEFIATEIPEVMVIRPEVVSDERGFFMETFRLDRFEKQGLHSAFVQDNYSGSGYGVLRGLHYQIRKPQGKLIQVISGQIYDVAVDLRRHSPTFGKCVGLSLSADERIQLWIKNTLPVLTAKDQRGKVLAEAESFD